MLETLPISRSIQTLVKAVGRLRLSFEIKLFSFYLNRFRHEIKLLNFTFSVEATEGIATFEKHKENKKSNEPLISFCKLQALRTLDLLPFVSCIWCVLSCFSMPLCNQYSWHVQSEVVLFFMSLVIFTCFCDPLGKTVAWSVWIIAADAGLYCFDYFIQQLFLMFTHPYYKWVCQEETIFQWNQSGLHGYIPLECFENASMSMEYH